MSLIVHARLVYPVYGIRMTSPAVAENIVATFYGGLRWSALTLVCQVFFATWFVAVGSKLYTMR